MAGNWQDVLTAVLKSPAVWAGLVAFAAQSAMDTHFYALRQAALFWMCAGLAVGLSERLASGPDAS